MSTFEQFNLPKSVQKAIDELGFTTPTPIQEKSFSVIMSGRDMMGIAQTGTGKTFAYLLPLLKLYKFTHTKNRYFGAYPRISCSSGGRSSKINQIHVGEHSWNFRRCQHQYTKKSGLRRR
jgi:hypothetical protein